MQILLVVLIIIFFYFHRRRNKLEKQAQLLNKLLYIEKSPQKYMDEVDKLLSETLSEKEKNINLIQKTTGLLYSGEFSEAIRVLTEDVSKIPPNWQVYYYHKLLLSLYLNNEAERANEILKAAKGTIDMYYKKDYNKVTIELIYAVSNFYNGNIVNCRDFFFNLKDVAANDYRIALGHYFTGKILESEGKTEDAQSSFEQAKAYGKGSFMEKL